MNFLFNKKNLTKNFYINKISNKKIFFYDIYWNDMRIWGTTALILVHLSRIIKILFLKMFKLILFISFGLIALILN